MATLVPMNKAVAADSGTVQFDLTTDHDFQLQRPDTLRQRKSSYFRSWERHLRSADGFPLPIPKTPIRSATVQQDLVRIREEPSTAREESRNPLRQTEKTENSDKSESANDHAQGLRLGLILLSLALAVFLVALDETIIATAIPKITEQFGSTQDVGCLVTSCSFRLLYGKLYTVFPSKYILVFAVVWFEAGSLLSGLAPTSSALIVGRLISGIGSAGIGTGFSIVLAHSVPRRRLPVFSSAINSVYGVASVATPLIGGSLTTSLSWRWCFLINLPLGMAAFTCITFALRPNNKSYTAPRTLAEIIKHYDLFGISTFLPGIVMVLVALQSGGTKYSWRDARVLVLLVLGVLVLLLFLYVEHRASENAVVPPRIAKQRSVAFGALYSFATGASATVVEYYLPIWFQTIKRDSPITSGFMMLPTILGFVVFALIAGLGVTYTGYYVPFMIMGSIFMTLGAGLLTTLGAKSGQAAWISFQIPMGMGGGFGVEQPYIAAMTVLDLADVPSGVAFVSFSQAIGSTLSVTIAEVVFSMTRQSGLRQSHAALSASFGSLQLEVSADASKELVRLSNLAITRTFFIAVAGGVLAVVASLGMEWVSVKETNEKVAEKDVNQGV